MGFSYWILQIELNFQHCDLNVYSTSKSDKKISVTLKLLLSPAPALTIGEFLMGTPALVPDHPANFVTLVNYCFHTIILWKLEKLLTRVDRDIGRHTNFVGHFQVDTPEFPEIILFFHFFLHSQYLQSIKMPMKVVWKFYIASIFHSEINGCVHLNRSNCIWVKLYL